MAGAELERMLVQAQNRHYSFAHYPPHEEQSRPLQDAPAENVVRLLCFLHWVPLSASS